MLISKREKKDNRDYIHVYSDTYYIEADGVIMKEDTQPIEIVDRIKYIETDIPLENEVRE